MEKKSDKLSADDPTIEEQALDFAATRTDVLDDAVTLGTPAGETDDTVDQLKALDNDVMPPGKPKRK